MGKVRFVLLVPQCGSSPILGAVGVGSSFMGVKRSETRVSGCTDWGLMCSISSSWAWAQCHVEFLTVHSFARVIDDALRFHVASMRVELSRSESHVSQPNSIYKTTTTSIIFLHKHSLCKYLPNLSEHVHYAAAPPSVHRQPVPWRNTERPALRCPIPDRRLHPQPNQPTTAFPFFISVR